jgi:prepilin signal peptidase PulO-like enzyme (type II secretory pathway)
VLWFEAAAAALSLVQLAADRCAGAIGLLERSRCPRCASALWAWEVLPVVGFLLLRGRCRRCGCAIPRRHLAGEAGRRGVLGALLTLGQGRWALYATGGALGTAALLAGAGAARAPATSRIPSGGG